MRTKIKKYVGAMCLTAGLMCVGAGTLGAQDNPPAGVRSTAPSLITPDMQQKHSKLYWRWRMISGGDVDKVIDLPANKGRKDIYVYTNQARPTQVTGSVGYPRVFISYLAVHSNVILVGRPVGSKSCLTEDHEFVFSDYEIDVDRVLKNDGEPIGSRIIVSRPGGVVQYRSRVVHGIYP